MRFRVHHLVFAGSLGLIGLLVALTLLLVGSGLERELSATLRTELGRRLALAASLMEARSAADPHALAREIAERTGDRVTLVDPAGVVVGDSEIEATALSGLENHGDRPEIQRALARPGATVYAERMSETVGEALLYGARAVRAGERTMAIRLAASRSDVRRAVEGARRAVAVAGLLASLGALVVAYLLSRALALPLVALAERARVLASGDFSVRVSPTGVRELQEVATAFNRLGEQLDARLSELRAERDEIQALIDCMAEGAVAVDDDGRLIRINRVARVLLGVPDAGPGTPIRSFVRHPELRSVLEAKVPAAEAREIEQDGRHLLLASRSLDHGGTVTTILDVTEVRRLESVRRDFVANASHELKTPLTSIRGFAEALVEDEPPELVRRRFYEAIRGNTLRMQRLVDDLLDLSRLEAGAWPVQPETVFVEGAAGEAWAMLKERAGGRTFGVQVEGAGTAAVDREILVQIFRNLLENAARHTEPDGRIEVRVRPGAGRTVTIEVADDGEGIPARALPRIFERFYRADSARAREAGGTGLGLAIVKHLVSAAGGRIEAESELGRGTVVRFTLPVPRYDSVTGA